MTRGEDWPSLPLDAWRDTCATLHLWTQIVGKIRLALAPPINHWWHVPLYVTAPRAHDLADPLWRAHLPDRFRLHRPSPGDRRSDGRRDASRCVPRSVADFHAETHGPAARASGSTCGIWTTPVEIADPIPFEQDRIHAAYDPDAATASGTCWCRPTKCSPNSAAGFSARRARCISSGAASISRSPAFPAAPRRRRRAPEHGRSESPAKPIRTRSAAAASGRAAAWDGPTFYCYAYPPPAGFADAAFTAPGAYYCRELGEFILPYDAVRQARPRRGCARLPPVDLRGGGRPRPMGPCRARPHGAGP